ncbi:DUF3108 domain-containing protein [Riemerella columbipharyngis]|uniref:DUF3108 domain-containing protein n=1 Tax=Riemerella columbipharyngis TaxID=1071918 RepID=A0A1G6ZK53_9FLAO|nr:DUF3108 domain-containing protein [Riemerella columbipharyngis]SDE01946.1 Protein of unknown function [Riemerella columbipharyngis]
MKKIFLLLLFVMTGLSSAQINNIKSGEKLVYRVHYGPLNAGYATLTATNTTYKGQPTLFVKGEGRTSRTVGFFFKVKDLYESFINIKTGLPSYYIRNVKEGNYTQHLETVFNHDNNTLILSDKKNNTPPKMIKTVSGVQDMLSAFYYLRSLNNKNLNIGSVIKINVWIDDNLFPFQLRVVGKDVKSTKFGKIECLRIIPRVMSGRVFKDKEGVTMWVTNDANHIPIEVKAELAVGSLKADIDDYQNIMFPINFK